MNDGEESEERQRLLDALDSEISRREREDNRLGISYWGLVGTFFVVGWMALEHGLDSKTVHWIQVLLVFFAAHVGLGRLYHFFHGAQPTRPAFVGVVDGPRYMTFEQVISTHGALRSHFYYMLIECTGLIALATILAFHGYPFLGGVIAVGNLLAVITITFGVVLSSIRFPAIPSDSVGAKTERKGTKIAVALLKIVTIPLSAVSVVYVLLDWTKIESDDWKMGLLLAALLQLLNFISTRAPRSIDLEPLEGARTKLAFGWCPVAEAKREVDDILLGRPADRFVSAKVTELCAVLAKQRRSAERVAESIRQLIALKAEFDACEDKETFRKKNGERVRRAWQTVANVIKKAPSEKERAETIRRSIKARSEIARITLDLTDDEAATLNATIAEAEEAKENAFRAIPEVHAVRDAYNAMIIPAEKKSTWAALRELRKLYRDADL